jgi:hypothetical protein
MPKKPGDILKTLDTRLKDRWSAIAAGQPVAWSPRFTLAPPKVGALKDDFSSHMTWVHEWLEWARDRGVELDLDTKNVYGSGQAIPQAVIVPDLDTAARLVGDGWIDKLARARQLAGNLTEQFPSMQDPAVLRTVVQKITDWTDLDIEILTAAATWFQTNNGDGRTPRQIPIPGMQAKWLNTRNDMVRALSGRRELNLSAPHPPRVHFTYLDPDHIDAGGRRHDCHSLGDRNMLPYKVRAVIICENKDTAIAFPKLPGAIAVEGAGSGPGAIPELQWVRDAPLVAYWGDLDADGLEILAQFRATGVVHHSMLMDPETYREWGQYGTNHDRKGRLLTGRTPKTGLQLEPNEQAVYEMVCDHAFTGFRRLEQERIPLVVAHERLSALLGD